MLKRILLLLGETRSSLSARDAAFDLAGQTGADITGLAGVDLAAIEAPMPGALGAYAFKVRLEQQLKQQAGEKRTRLHAAFEQACKERGAKFEWLSFDGDPIGALYLATEGRDLVVTGHDTAFEGNIVDQLPEVVSKLLLATPRPVIVCGDQALSGKDVLIAYDGSVAAMRALQMFVLLGFAAGRRVHVTSIAEDQETAVRRTSGAAGYLVSHGYEVESVPIATQVAAAEVLSIEVADRGVGTMVLGAYGHRGFAQILFGSTTSAVVSAPPCPLFLYH